MISRRGTILGGTAAAGVRADPQETRDLAQDQDYGNVVKDCEAALREVVDPEEADRQAFSDQEARLTAAGGREAVLARGTFGFSPVPGFKPVYEAAEARRGQSPA